MSGIRHVANFDPPLLALCSWKRLEWVNCTGTRDVSCSWTVRGALEKMAVFRSGVSRGPQRGDCDDQWGEKRKTCAQHGK